MGLTADDINMVTRLRKQGHFTGNQSIIEIGAQQLTNDLLANDVAIAEIGEAFGVPPRQFSAPLPTSLAHGLMEAQNPEAPPAREFWEWLGFRYSAVDVDGSPDAIPLDLNFDSAPENMRGQFALVTNCGTTEHIANQLNATKVIHDLCATGGVMLHHLPAQGYVGHGLLHYNPKFFWMLSRSNGYKTLHLDFRTYASYDLPKEIIEELLKFHSESDIRARDCRLSDGSILIAMQKLYDIDYVPPIDVPNGSDIANPELSERYWTVFRPERFDMLIDRIEATKSRKFKIEVKRTELEGETVGGAADTDVQVRAVTPLTDFVPSGR